MDENGNVIPSSAYLAESDTFFARSRFTKIVTKLEEFTAENLEKAIIDAIVAEEKETGISTVTYEEQKAQNTSTPLDFDKIQDELAEWGSKLIETNNKDTLVEIVESVLGAGKTVSGATKKQTEALAIILEEIKATCVELGIA